MLSPEDEAALLLSKTHFVAARRLPLCIAADIPYLTRSSLHRCLQRHGISRLPEVQGDRPVRKRFKSYPIGYFYRHR
ncbi:putative integrase catalytic core [Acinetobacter sp. AR_0276]|nr:putative integrase catalytic core [Acinetobacter sp. AR_0276]